MDDWMINSNQRLLNSIMKQNCYHFGIYCIKKCVELNLKLFSCHAGFNLFNYLEFFHYKKGGNECVKERNILNSNLIFLMSIKQPFLSHNPLEFFLNADFNGKWCEF